MDLQYWLLVWNYSNFDERPNPIRPNEYFILLIVKLSLRISILKILHDSVLI